MFFKKSKKLFTLFAAGVLTTANLCGTSAMRRYPAAKMVGMQPFPKHYVPHKEYVLGIDVWEKTYSWAEIGVSAASLVVSGAKIAGLAKEGIMAKLSKAVKLTGGAFSVFSATQSDLKNRRGIRVRVSYKTMMGRMCFCEAKHDHANVESEKELMGSLVKIVSVNVNVV